MRLKELCDQYDTGTDSAAAEWKERLARCALSAQGSVRVEDVAELFAVVCAKSSPPAVHSRLLQCAAEELVEASKESRVVSLRLEIALHSASLSGQAILDNVLAAWCNTQCYHRQHNSRDVLLYLIRALLVNMQSLRAEVLAIAREVARGSDLQCDVLARTTILARKCNWSATLLRRHQAVQKSYHSTLLVSNLLSAFLDRCRLVDGLCDETQLVDDAFHWWTKAATLLGPFVAYTRSVSKDTPSTLLERDFEGDEATPYTPQNDLILPSGWKRHFSELDKLINLDTPWLILQFLAPQRTRKRKAVASAIDNDDDEVEFVKEEGVEERNARGFDAAKNPNLIEL